MINTKHLLSICMTGLLLLSTSCKNSSPKKEAEMIIKEKELLEREKEILKKENEELKTELMQNQEQKGFEEYEIIVEKSSSLQQQYSIEDVVGMWNVTLSCISSDCSNSKPGDIKTESWQIQYLNGSVNVKVSNSDTNVKEYQGTFLENTLTLNSSKLAGLILDSGKAVVNVSFLNQNEMVGNREVISGFNNSICIIKYSVNLTRSN